MAAVPQCPRARGFTLIELMIVVMILAILTLIAVPSYERYVANSKLTQAKSNLTLLSTLMERYYQDHNAYTSNLAALQGWSPGNNPYFSYTITTPYAGLPAPSFQLTATALTGKGIDGYVFQLDSGNNQSETLPGGQVVQPWQ